jgi:hypothetical protein
VKGGKLCHKFRHTPPVEALPRNKSKCLFGAAIQHNNRHILRGRKRASHPKPQPQPLKLKILHRPEREQN